MLEAGYEKLDGEGARSLKKWRVRVCVCVCSLCVGGGGVEIGYSFYIFFNVIL